MSLAILSCLFGGSKIQSFERCDVSGSKNSLFLPMEQKWASTATHDRALKNHARYEKRQKSCLCYQNIFHIRIAVSYWEKYSIKYYCLVLRMGNFLKLFKPLEEPKHVHQCNPPYTKIINTVSNYKHI